jgi:tetratricopeptide (TPR) repeat protein
MKARVDAGGGDADDYCILGSCYTALDKTAEAINAFDQSLAIDPEFGEAVYKRALVYAKIGKKDLSAKEMKIAKKLGYDGTSND